MQENHYVDNKKLTEHLGQWTNSQRERKLSGLPPERVPDYIGLCILEICNNIIHKPNLCGYTWVDDMVGDAIENCIRYLHNFNIKKSNNAFGYISLVATRAMLRRIKKEKLKSSRHLDYIKRIVDIGHLSDILSSFTDNDQVYYADYINNIRNFITDFEDDEIKESNEIKEELKESTDFKPGVEEEIDEEVEAEIEEEGIETAIPEQSKNNILILMMEEGEDL